MGTSRFPFYFEMKTLLLLFLALPQIQVGQLVVNFLFTRLHTFWKGSTFVYQKYLQPFFSKNEPELDAGITSFQNNIWVFVQTRLSSLIDIIWSLVNKTPASRQPAAPGTGQQPAGAPASGFTMDSALSLLRAYGPAVMGGLSRSPGAGQSASSPSASISFQPSAAPNTERSLSNPSINSTPVGTPDSHSAAAPPFPEPQHF
jgi:receptor expression-enhancing protein 1/2/3/4